MMIHLRFFLVLIFISTFNLANAQALTAQEKADLQRRVEAANQRIDSIQNKSTLETRRFIESMYQQILRAIPSDIELQTMELLLTGYNEGDEHEEPLANSHLVEQLLVLLSGEDELSWEFVEDHIELLENLDLTRAPTVGFYNYRYDLEYAAQKKKYLKPLRNDGEYKVYHGFLHAHTELSDGRGEAKEAYAMARDQAGLDYFAVTDHSEALHFWPWDKKYKQLIEVANSFNSDGKFAALYGFEWSHPLLGHFNVVNTDTYTSCILKPEFYDFMNWVGKRTGAFGRFNHPGRVNWKHWPHEFKELKVFNQALHNVIGIEMWNKKRGLKHYLENEESFMPGYNYLDNANLNGWFVGAVGGQDNHDADWGLRNDYRVGVWAEGLTRKDIVSAHFARRTFATEDKNSWVSFKINGAQMGSRLTEGSYDMNLSFGDDDGESVMNAKLVKKGKVIKTYTIGKSQSVSDKLSGEIGDYYYIIAQQADGDLLMSSPIWFVPQ